MSTMSTMSTLPSALDAQRQTQVVQTQKAIKQTEIDALLEARRKRVLAENERLAEKAKAFEAERTKFTQECIDKVIKRIKIHMTNGSFGFTYSYTMLSRSFFDEQQFIKILTEAGYTIVPSPYTCCTYQISWAPHSSLE